MKKLILISLLLTGCAQNQYYVGASVHSTGVDDPEFTAENPVCMFGFEYQLTENIKGFSEHQSSCFYREYGAGFNSVGAKYYF